MTRIVVVSAGLRQPSSTRLLADQLGAASRDALERDGHRVEVTVVELREMAHDIVNAQLTGFASPALQEVFHAVAAADGLIAVTPVFNASYSGLFKSFVDVLDAEALRGTPVLLGATGGTARHSLALDHALRPLFSYLHALVVPTAVFAATADWGSGGEGAAVLAERVSRAGAELAQLVVALPRERRAADELDVTPFEDLLAGR